jgi:hypothetical protein
MSKSFWNQVNKNGPLHPVLGTRCWLWTGATGHGYGTLTVDGKHQKAHRYAFFLNHGHWPTPCGLHKCDNRPCVNPGHIFEGTLSDNCKDRAAKGRSHRPKGSLHPRAKLNTKVVKQILGRAHKESTREIAKSMGLSRGTVGDIVSGRRWPHASD